MSFELRPSASAGSGLSNSPQSMILATPAETGLRRLREDKMLMWPPG
jgi:hypothetical protein